MLCEPAACSGCGACQNSCAYDAIKMRADARGFLHPVIDAAACHACGKCSTVCPALNAADISEIIEAYACISTEFAPRSSSGGMFSALAKEILQSGGIVFGTVMESDGYSAYCSGTDAAPLTLLCKSKYIESDARAVYPEIAHALIHNRPVLFCSTPCKIAAAKRYIMQAGLPDEQLFLVDFRCHGVSSPMVWEKYMRLQEATHSAKCTGVDFRCKKFGWEFSHVLKLVFQNGSVFYGDSIGDPWYRLYIKGLGLRTSCFSCDALRRSSADITLGDDWSASLKKRGGAHGRSLVLVRSKKGRDLLKSCKDRIWMEQLPDKYRTNAAQADKSTEDNDRYFADLLTEDFSFAQAAKKFAKTSPLRGRLMRNRQIRFAANSLYRLLGRGNK